MIDSERMKIFLSTFSHENPSYLKELKTWCIEKNYPIIRQETEGLLRAIIALKKPERILEIGTCAGYSASFMMHCVLDSRYLYSSSYKFHDVIGEKIITTLEIRSEHVEEAKENFKKFGIEDYINVIEGDAEKSLDALLQAKGIKGFDLAFIDAAKGHYGSYFDKAFSLLNKDGVIICDNVLQDESMLDSRYTIVQRDRTIHDRMRAFLYDITHREDLVTDILPIADGMSVSVKR